MKVLFVFLTVTANVFGGELAKPKAYQNTRAYRDNLREPVKLGSCEPAPNEEESAARKLAEGAGLAKEEILARLMYSEALSTGYWMEKCNSESVDAIMKSIGWGTMNRIKGKSATSLDAYSDVVFAKKQFRTSFSGKKENPFAKAFLCPLTADTYLKSGTKKDTAANLYKKAQEAADSIVSEYEKTGIPEKYKGITNFFYPESEFFGEMRPKWAPEKDPSKNKGYVETVGAKQKPCVEAYKLK